MGATRDDENVVSSGDRRVEVAIEQRIAIGWVYPNGQEGSTTGLVRMPVGQADRGYRWVGRESQAKREQQGRMSGWSALVRKWYVVCRTDYQTRPLVWCKEAPSAPKKQPFTHLVRAFLLWSCTFAFFREVASEQATAIRKYCSNKSCCAESTD